MLAPVIMLVVQLKCLHLNLFGDAAIPLLRPFLLVLFQTGVAIAVKTSLPVVKRAASDMRFPACCGDAARGLPGLEQ